VIRSFGLSLEVPFDPVAIYATTKPR
jgi:hypothetical protein